MRPIFKCLEVCASVCALIDPSTIGGESGITPVQLFEPLPAFGNTGNPTVPVCPIFKCLEVCASVCALIDPSTLPRLYFN